MKSSPPHAEAPLGRVLRWSALLCPSLLLLVPPILSDRVFFHEDLEFYFYGLRGMLRSVLETGTFHAWNPWTSLGIPLLADIQLAPLYPLNLFFYVLPPGPAFNLYFLAHALIGTWVAYLWLRGSGRAPWSATFGSLVFVWSGFFWAHLHHATFMAAGIWLPALLLGWDHLQRASFPLVAWWRIGLPLGLAALAGGSPQLLYYELLTLGAYALWRSGNASSGRFPLRSLLSGTVGVAFGLGCAAAQLIPAYRVSLERYVTPGTALDFSSSFALSPLALGRALVPNLFGNDFFGRAGVGWDGPGTYWESWCYLGVLTLGLVALALRLRGENAFYSWLFGLSLLGCLGKLGGVHTLLVWLLPYYDQFRAPSRLFLLTSLAAAALSSRALDRLSQPAMQEDDSPVHARLPRVRTFLLVLGLEVWAISGLSIFLREAPLHPVAAWGWGLALLNLLGAWAFLRQAGALQQAAGGSWLSRLGPGPFAVLLLLVDLLPVLWTYNRPVPLDDVTRLPSLVTRIQAQLEPLGPDGRVLVARDTPPYLLNAGTEFRFRTVRGYNPLNPGRLARFLEASDRSPPREGGISLRVDDLGSEMLRLLAAPLVVTRASLDSDRFEALEGDPERGLKLYRDRLARPRAWVSGEARYAPGVAAALTATREVARESIPPVVLETTVPPGPLDRRAAASASVRFVRDQADVLELHLATSGPVFLVVADSFASGWTAEINGEPTPIHPAFHALRAVYVPHAGEHRVVMRYQTPGVDGAAVVSVFALLLVQLAFALDRRGGLQIQWGRGE